MAVTLVLFDVDGTLTATGDSDMKCYAATFEKVFGTPLPSIDWHSYTHVTDSGVLGEVLEQMRGSFVTTYELEQFEEAFVRELEAEYSANPASFTEVPGARALLEMIASRDEFCAALATGCMKGSALFKLSKIGVDGTSMPGSFANDAFSREEIVEGAIKRANTDTGHIVYVGDSPWDVRTAAALKLGFVGITKESSPQELKAAGATVCLEDYSDPDAFLNALCGAPVPEVRN